jgi:hypothetical protein
LRGVRSHSWRRRTFQIERLAMKDRVLSESALPLQGSRYDRRIQ